MFKSRWVGSFFVAAWMLAMVAGCGNSNLGSVSGKVTLDGEPLADALVRFNPLTGGRPAAARTDSNGHYVLKFDRDSEGAMLGEHQIEISTADEIVNDDNTVEIVPEKIPAKYNFASELKRTVEAGSNVIDFDLKSEGEIIQGDAEASADDGSGSNSNE